MRIETAAIFNLLSDRVPGSTDLHQLFAICPLCLESSANRGHEHFRQWMREWQTPLERKKTPLISMCTCQAKKTSSTEKKLFRGAVWCSNMGTMMELMGSLCTGYRSVCLHSVVTAFSCSHCTDCGKSFPEHASLCHESLPCTQELNFSISIFVLCLFFKLLPQKGKLNGWEISVSSSFIVTKFFWCGRFFDGRTDFVPQLSEYIVKQLESSYKRAKGNILGSWPCFWTTWGVLRFCFRPKFQVQLISYRTRGKCGSTDRILGQDNARLCATERSPSHPPSALVTGRTAKLKSNDQK